jgi:hypothetical protein
MKGRVIPFARHGGIWASGGTVPVIVKLGT